MAEQQLCPLCKTEVPYSGRYPNYICYMCCSKGNVKDSEGNLVEFYNSTPIGTGFLSLHTIDGKVVKKEEHTCFVKGVKCYAEEARFGGIVIQLFGESWHIDK